MRICRCDRSYFSLTEANGKPRFPTFKAARPELRWEDIEAPRG
jgi:hypothetical protein